MGVGMFLRFLALCLLLVPVAAFAEADAGPFTVTVLPFSADDTTVEDVTNGWLDGEFTSFDYRATRERGGSFWLRLVPQAGIDTRSGAALAVRKGRHLYLRAYDSHARAGQPLVAAAALPNIAPSTPLCTRCPPAEPRAIQSTYTSTWRAPAPSNSPSPCHRSRTPSRAAGRRREWSQSHSAHCWPCP